MFTIDQIKAAHSKVRSGADFPAYIKDLKTLGVTSYTTYVYDRHAQYSGANGYNVSSAGQPDLLTVADSSNPAQFKSDLKKHQQGGTDYPTFCRDAAKSGIEKWTMDLVKMTCTYYDKGGKAILEEAVPG